MKALLEVQVFEGEMCFHDAGGLDSSSQHVLLCGDVVWLGYPLQVIKIAEKSNKNCFSIFGKWTALWAWGEVL